MRAQIVTVTAVRFGRILDKTRWTEPQGGAVVYVDCNENRWVQRIHIDMGDAVIRMELRGELS